MEEVGDRTTRHRSPSLDNSALADDAPGYASATDVPGSASVTDDPESTAEEADDDAFEDTAMHVEVPAIPQFTTDLDGPRDDTVGFPPPPQLPYTMLTATQQKARLSSIVTPDFDSAHSITTPTYDRAHAAEVRNVFKTHVQQSLAIMQAASSALKDFDAEVSPNLNDKLKRAADAASSVADIFRDMQRNCSDGSCERVGDVLNMLTL